MEGVDLKKLDSNNSMQQVQQKLSKINLQKREIQQMSPILTYTQKEPKKPKIKVVDAQEEMDFLEQLKTLTVDQY